MGQTRASKINEAKNEASKNAEGSDNEKNSDNDWGRRGASDWRGRGRGHFRGSRGDCQRGSGSAPPFWMPPAGANPWGDLMNIGQAVRQALDPFGVDVDIEVETPAGKQKVDKAKEEQTKAKDTTEAVKEAPKPVEKAEDAKVE